MYSHLDMDFDFYATGTEMKLTLWPIYLIEIIELRAYKSVESLIETEEKFSH